MNEGKPANIAEKMVAGRIEKFYKEICLLEQPFIKDTDKTVQDVLNEKIATIEKTLISAVLSALKWAKGWKRGKIISEEVMKQIK